MEVGTLIGLAIAFFILHGIYRSWRKSLFVDRDWPDRSPSDSRRVQARHPTAPPAQTAAAGEAPRTAQGKLQRLQTLVERSKGQIPTASVPRTDVTRPPEARQRPAAQPWAQTSARAQTPGPQKTWARTSFADTVVKMARPAPVSVIIRDPKRRSLAPWLFIAALIFFLFAAYALVTTPSKPPTPQRNAAAELAAIG